jgi:hypothetical protein
MAVHLDCHWIKVGVEHTYIDAMHEIMGDRWRPGRQLDAEGFSERYVAGIG